MARFYGWTNREIESLPYSEYVTYLKCIDNLTATEDLRNCSSASFANPNLKKDARQKTLAQLRKTSSDGIDTGPANYADVAKALAKGMKNNG